MYSLYILLSSIGAKWVSPRSRSHLFFEAILALFGIHLVAKRTHRECDCVGLFVLPQQRTMEHTHTIGYWWIAVFFHCCCRFPFYQIRAKIFTFKTNTHHTHHTLYKFDSKNDKAIFEVVTFRVSNEPLFQLQLHLFQICCIRYRVDAFTLIGISHFI